MYARVSYNSVQGLLINLSHHRHTAWLGILTDSTEIILSLWSHSRRPLLRPLANLLPRLSLWSFDHLLDSQRLSIYCFSTSHTDHWWPRRKEGEDPEDGPLPPPGEVAESAWNSAFEQQPSDQWGRRSEVSRRIHILGVGNVGLLIAHSLAGIPNRPPITFLARTRASVRSFTDAGQCVNLITDGVSEIRRGFDIEHAFEDAEPPWTTDHRAISSQTHTVGAYAFANRATPADGPSTCGAFSPMERSEGRDADAASNGIDFNANKVASDDGVIEEEASQISDHEYSLSTKAKAHAYRAVSTETATSDEASQEPGYENYASNSVDVNANQEVSSDNLMPTEAYQGSRDGYSPLDDQEGIITNLIVSLKAKDILGLQRVAHRLTKDSAILFVQNGMGYIDKVNDIVFPDPETRPNYIIGVITHGAKRTKAYTVVHAGHGTIALTILPRVNSATTQTFPPSARYLLRTITRTPVLAAVAYSPTELLQLQLEKLAINCIINPLTALMDCTNGELIHNYHITRVMRLLLAEISLVIRSLPELQNIPNVQSRFDPGRLELATIRVAGATSLNLSSMLQDVRAGKETEIDFINGYIIRKGEEIGIRCIMNYMLMHMLEAKQKIVDRNEVERLPIGTEDSLMIHAPK